MGNNVFIPTPDVFLLLLMFWGFFFTLEMIFSQSNLSSKFFLVHSDTSQCFHQWMLFSLFFFVLSENFKN